MAERRFAQPLESGERSRAADEELRRSEERLRNLIESLDDLVFTVDTEGRLTYVSGAVSRYGYSPAEVLGHRFQDFAHPDDREALAREFATRLASDVGPYEFRVFDAKGRIRIVRSSGRRVLEGDRVTGLAGVLIDLTVQRQTEEQLRLAKRMEAVGTLAGGIAHDFNNILTVITSYAGLAARRLAPDDPLRADLAQIRKAADRATALTRQLLAFSRKQVLEPAVIDVNALVEGLQKMLVRVIGENVELRFVPGVGLGRIKADPGQVEQVVMNLVVNARDAMPTGGTITIESRNAELDEEFVSRHHGARTGPHVQLSVRDTGAGMDAATRDRLFEPFFTTKAPGEGTGLGLATVYGIVKQSGGSIWVDSAPGAGTTFDVYLPRVEEPLSERPPPRAGPALQGGRETLLFVEDDEAVRSLAQRVFADAGYGVLAAANGGEALLLASRHAREIDLVVTDVVMPGLGGKELAERLGPILGSKPILFISGHSDDAIALQGTIRPGARFLAKPFTPETVLEKVREALDLPR